jgi:2-polyprenyl-6-hydroxyphenyl methylase/3-demethylubiquinone-9 3-methyltransferase
MLTTRTAPSSTPPCKICGGDAPLFGVVDFAKQCNSLRPALSGTPVYYRQCGQCRFVFTDAFDSWSLAEFRERIYNAEYDAVDPDYRDRRPRANANLIATRVKPGMTCLDYGGGNGRLAQLLRQRGFDAHSYDPFTPGEDDLPAGIFGLVSCFEVLEHVPDPRATIAALASKMSASGVVLFSTLLMPDDQGVDWWYLAPRNGHISLFSRAALALAWRLVGCRVGSLSDDLHIARWH